MSNISVDAVGDVTVRATEFCCSLCTFVVLKFRSVTIEFQLQNQQITP